MSAWLVPISVALITAFFAFLGVWLLYKRGGESNALVRQTTIATVETGSVAMAIDALNKLVDQLQEERGEDRIRLTACFTRVRELELIARKRK